MSALTVGVVVVVSCGRGRTTEVVEVVGVNALLGEDWLVRAVRRRIVVLL